VIIAGRAADSYNPNTVRARLGSLFAVSAVRAETPTAVVDWLRTVDSITLVGTSEDAVTNIWKHDFRESTSTQPFPTVARSRKTLRLIAVPGMTSIRSRCQGAHLTPGVFTTIAHTVA
jgi:hypothetical protein